MKHSSLSKLFWGLLLLFFNIRIAHLELLTTSLGMLLLVVAVWQLSQNSLLLKRAFVFSIAAAALKATEIILFCLRQGSEITFSLPGGLTATGNIGIAFGMSLLGSICMLALLYNLFRGIGLIADQMGNALMAQRLYRCFWLYLANVMLSYAAMLIPALALLVIILLFVLPVYILVQVYRFGVAADEYAALNERRLSPRFYGAMGGSVLLVLVLSFAALLFMNEPRVSSQPYVVQNGTSAKSQTAELRNRLQKLGFKQAVLDDLPDNEILRYEGVQSVHTASQNWSCDNGTICMTEYFIKLAPDKVRILHYYEWLTLPQNRYCDSFYIDMNSQLLSVFPESGLDGFSLYDEKAAGGTATRKVNFLKLQGSADSGSLTPLVKYRLLGSEALHQRGFIAYFAQFPKDREGGTAQMIANYTHQTSLFDFGETNQQTNQVENQYFTMQSSSAEQRFQLTFDALL